MNCKPWQHAGAIGLAETTAANAAFWNNFEIVATTLIAMLVLRERVSGGCLRQSA